MEAGRGRRERGVAKKCMPFVRVRARTELRPLSPSSSPALMGGGRCNVVNRGRLWWTANCPPSRRVSGASEPGLLARACPAAAAGPEPPRPRVPAMWAGKMPKLPLSPDLCPSCAGTDPPLPSACACVYSSPSRRTPVGRQREPREPDTAEDAGGQTDHLGQAYRGGLRRNLFFHKPPSFMNSLNPLFFSTLKSLFGRRVRSWLRTNAGGAPNTCKSRG